MNETKHWTQYKTRKERFFAIQREIYEVEK